MPLDASIQALWREAERGLKSAACLRGTTRQCPGLRG